MIIDLQQLIIVYADIPWWGDKDWLSSYELLLADQCGLSASRAILTTNITWYNNANPHVLWIGISTAIKYNLPIIDQIQRKDIWDISLYLPWQEYSLLDFVAKNIPVPHERKFAKTLVELKNYRILCTFLDYHKNYSSSGPEWLFSAMSSGVFAWSYFDHVRIHCCYRYEAMHKYGNPQEITPYQFFEILDRSKNRTETANILIKYAIFTSDKGLIPEAITFNHKLHSTLLVEDMKLLEHHDKWPLLTTSYGHLIRSKMCPLPDWAQQHIMDYMEEYRPCAFVCLYGQTISESILERRLYNYAIKN
jgi:hypothetical protein